MTHEPTWEWDWITVDEGDLIIYAQYRTDYRWNGWLCPRMTWEQALAVVGKLMLDASDYYRVEMRGAGVIAIIRSEDGYEEHPEDADVYAPDADGMYHIGAMSWCWEKADGFAVDFDTAEEAGMDGTLRGLDGREIGMPITTREIERRENNR